MTAMVDEATAQGHGDDWDYELLWTNLKTLYPITLTIDEVIEEAGGKSKITRDFLHSEILSDAKLAYQAREDALGEQTMRELELRVVLSVIGRKWQEHLYEMDYLKEGIGLRAMAQRDPLVEYQREGFILFQAMMEAIREETIGYLFNLEVEVAAPAAPASNGLGVQDGRGLVQVPSIRAAGLEAPQRPASLNFSAPNAQGEVETHVERLKTAVAETKARAERNGSKRPKK